MILSLSEKAIFPWFGLLMSQWKPAPEEMTEAKEKALYRLIGGGFIEARVEVLVTPFNGATAIGGVWRISGPFPDELNRQIIAFGQSRGMEDEQVRLIRRVSAAIQRTRILARVHESGWDDAWFSIRPPRFR